MDLGPTASEPALPPLLSPEPPPATSTGAARVTAAADLDRAVAELGDHARAFARTAPQEKAALLRAILPRFLEIAPEQVALACHAKGLDPDGRFAGEEWLAGPMPVLTNIRLLIAAMLAIAVRGRPDRPGRLKLRPDGRVEAPIAPAGRLERAQLGDMRLSVLFEEGVGPADVPETQARFYRTPEPEGAVSLILGAGNVASITPMDALFKLFVEGQVALIKMSPANDYLGPLLERAFAPLVERGFVRIVYGGGDVGAYLAQHRGVGAIHLTGSAATHDLLVWGPPGPERQRRIGAGEPLLTKPISSELGNISPVLVAPYLYASDDLWFLARSVASQVTNNASFNCNAAKMLVLPRGWRQQDLFLELLRKALAGVPPRRAYYPGAVERYLRLTAGRSRLLRIGAEDVASEILPWTIVPDLDPAKLDEPLFSTEPFCGLLSVVSIGSDDPSHFFDEATAFCNDQLWGSLNAEILVPPVLEEDPATAAALEAAIRKLRYGSVAVNQWPAMIYALAAPPWGGHPSSSLADIQSGRGFVHNTWMFERIDKAILRAPLRLSPKPPFFCDHRRMRELGQRLTSFAAAPSLSAFASVAVTALRG
jgi:acyl-CoA reductase-like NAD-dependent aldehyde dehydrogenase